MANKAELVTDVAAATGLTKKDATSAVDAVFESIQASLAKGDKVQLIGFGNFEVRQRAARRAVTHKQVKKFKFLQAKYQLSNLVRRSRMLLNSIHLLSQNGICRAGFFIYFGGQI